MQKKECLSCGRSYFVLAGHSCGDSAATQEVRGLLAKEIQARQTLEDGIKALDEILAPIAKHFSGEYNKWRAHNPKAFGLMEATKHLIEYLKQRNI